jgi:hypothetical protein
MSSLPRPDLYLLKEIQFYRYVLYTEIDSEHAAERQCHCPKKAEKICSRERCAPDERGLKGSAAWFL